MNDQYNHTVTNLDYENMSENDSTTTVLDNELKNYMEILIAECVGLITKNYFIEHQQLAAYAYYPPLTPKQLRTIIIEKITSNEVKQQSAENVYKQLELAFPNKVVHWNSIVQTTAKRYVTNSVEQAIQTIQRRLSEYIDKEDQTANIIVQRFVLINNQLKLV